MNSDHKTRIRAFLDQHFPNNELADDDDIFAQGYVNSLFAMQLVLFIEESFGTPINNDDLELDNFRSIDRMAALVERQQGVAV